MNRTLIAMLLALLLCLPLSLALAEEEIVLGEPDGEIGLPEAADNDDGLLGLEEIAGDIDMGSDLEIDAIELNADLSLDGADLPEAVEAPAAANVGDAEDVPLDEAHFPDANFRKIIADCDNNPKDGVLSAQERAAITELEISDSDIVDVRGIGYFTSLRCLRCYCTQLTTLDVSGCKALNVLDCEGDQLTELNVRGLTALEGLYCNETILTSLDVSGCSSLKNLRCNDNSLTELNVRGLTALEILTCSSNQLTSLDVSGCTSLESVDCKFNHLTSLDVSGCSSLKKLLCNDNSLTKLNVRGLTALEGLGCSSNQLTSLDVNGCTSLEILICGDNLLTELDVTGCPELYDLGLSNTKLTSLDISKCSGLEYLELVNTPIKNLVHGNCNGLLTLDCSGTQFTSLDFISACHDLYILRCNDCPITSLDVSKYPELMILECGNTLIKELDIRECKELKTLICPDTKLTHLDAQKHTVLKELNCSNTQLTRLDIGRCTELEKLNCSNTQLTSLDVSDCTQLRELRCNNTRIGSLDVSKCTGLFELYCDGCQLKTLNINGVIWLIYIECSNNPLEILDLTGCEVPKKCVKKPTRVVTGDKKTVQKYEKVFRVDGIDETYYIAFDISTKITADGKTLYTPPSIGKCIVTDAAGETSAKLYKGDTLQLKGTVEKVDPETYTVIWKSSDEKVATVSDTGLVKAVGEGKCTITGKPINGEKGGFKVTVRKAPTSIALGQSKATLYIGKSLWLKKTVAPADAKTGFAWSSSDQKVATVDAKGKVTGVSKGTAVVTVQTDNGLKAACEVTVQQPPESVTLNESAAKLYIGDTLALKATLSPKDAEAVFTWKSSDEKVATVSAKGVVKGVGAGKAYISVRTGNGLKAGLTVNVRKAPTSIALDQSKATLYIGKSLWLTKTVAPADAKTGFAWSSSDQKVATVDAKGKVTGVSKGTAVVTVQTDNGLKAACEVTVQQPPESVTLNESAAKLYIGDTLALEATLSPKDAEAVFTWKSSNEKVATVSAKGVVKAVGAGKAYISVRTGNGLKAGLTVNVRKAPKGVKLSQTRATLVAGKTLRLKATVTPADAKTGFTWRSSDKKVATVDEKGVVTAVGKGAANITVETENGLKATCKVTVPTAPARIAFKEESYSMNVGKTVKLTTKLTPVKAQTTLTFSSSDGKIATVNSKGVVKGVKKGTATITVTTANGKTASVKVTVK